MLDVWDELMAVERRMDDLFRAYLGPKARTSFPPMAGLLHKPFIPTSDVFARDGDLVINLELPGIDPESDVTVTIEDGDLVIRGARHQTKEIAEEDYYRMESSYGSFERHLPVPEGTKDSDVSAEYRDGILELVIPKAAKQFAPPEKPTKKIPITTSSKK